MSSNYGFPPNIQDIPQFVNITIALKSVTRASVVVVVALVVVTAGSLLPAVVVVVTDPALSEDAVVVMSSLLNVVVVACQLQQVKSGDKGDQPNQLGEVR